MTVLLTGGNGTLGRELQKLLREQDVPYRAPSSGELDITRKASWDRQEAAETLIHCAGYTQTWEPELLTGWKREEAAKLCWLLNLRGTSLAGDWAAQNQARMVFISTDAIFSGEGEAPYGPEDTPSPVGAYAWSKYAGELMAELCPNHLIIRTSFRPSIWPYVQAPADAYTTADYVDVIAPLILRWALSDRQGIVHVGTERKDFYSLAQQRNPGVRRCSRLDLTPPSPHDRSLRVTEFSE